MLRHIVMWKMKAHAEGADRAANAIKVKELLDSCAALVPGIRRWEVALAPQLLDPDAASGLECTYDVVLYSEFEDRAALQAYQMHPRHEAMKPFIGAVREARQCMDYEG